MFSIAAARICCQWLMNGFRFWLPVVPFGRVLCVYVCVPVDRSVRKCVYVCITFGIQCGSRNIVCTSTHSLHVANTGIERDTYSTTYTTSTSRHLLSHCRFGLSSSCLFFLASFCSETEKTVKTASLCVWAVQSVNVMWCITHSGVCCCTDWDEKNRTIAV